MLKFLLYRWRNNHPIIKISIVVIISHFLLIAFLTYSYISADRTKNNPKQIVVNTIKLAPAKVVDINASVAAAEPTVTAAALPPPSTIVEKTKEPEPAPQPKPKVNEKATKKQPPKPTPKVDKKEKKKKIAKKKAEKSIPKKVVNTPSPEQQKLMRDLKESIAKIDERPHNISKKKMNSVVLPQKIDKLSVDVAIENNSYSGIGGNNKGTRNVNEVNIQDDSYNSILIRRLQEGLLLPEYGDVKVLLTLRRDGTVKQVTIISAENIKNREYVEKALQHFVFPNLGKAFKDETEHSFSIVLSNSF